MRHPHDADFRLAAWLMIDLALTAAPLSADEPAGELARKPEEEPLGLRIPADGRPRRGGRLAAMER
jgi:hypothetical protein